MGPLLPLSTLKTTPLSILYEIPPGKPGPKKEETTDEQTQGRVFQAGAKGGAYDYYAFNLLRKRIGKNAPEEFLSQRKTEQAFSQRRKALTTYYDKFPIPIEKLYSACDAPRLMSIRVKEAKKLLKKLLRKNASKTSEDLVSYIKGFSRSNLPSHLKRFIKEPKNHKNLHEFLVYKKNQAVTEINTKFLKEVRYADFQKEEVTIERQAALIKSLCVNLYDLDKSTWQPFHDIEELIDELKQKGPLMIEGGFGKDAYTTAPFAMTKKISTRTIYAWSRGAERNSWAEAGHCVLLVGARLVKDKKKIFVHQPFVYFIDPADPSDPLDPDKQKIYLISLKNLRDHIRPLEVSQQGPVYAYHGHFKI